MKKTIFFVVLILASLLTISSFAKDKEPPTGSADDVMTSSGGDQVVFELDFSDKNASIYTFKSLKFRIFCPYSTVQINVCNEAGEAVFATTVDEDQKRWWTEFEFTYESTLLLEEKSVVDLADENGNLGKIKIIIDKSKSKTEYVHIDTITLELREKDATAPLITFDGSNEISVTAEKTFTIKNLKAYDEYEKREVGISKKWEDGVKVDGYGCPPVGGPYKLTVTAVDTAGNKATEVFNVTIRPKDTEAPKFAIATDQITVLAGSIIDTDAYVTDNEDEVTSKAIWSKGALDKIGRITEGDHELTIFAIDLTGNETIKKITIHAVSKDSLSEITVTRDEGAMFFIDEYIVYFVIAGAVIALAVVAVVVIILVKKKKTTE